MQNRDTSYTDYTDGDGTATSTFDYYGDEIMHIYDFYNDTADKKVNNAMFFEDFFRIKYNIPEYNPCREHIYINKYLILKLLILLNKLKLINNGKYINLTVILICIIFIQILLNNAYIFRHKDCIINYYLLNL